MNKIEELIKEYCPNGVEIRCLEECCILLDRKRKPVTKVSRKAGEYPYYGANGIQDYVSDYIFDGIFVLVGEDGSVITKSGTPVVTWAEGKIWVNNHAHIIAEKDGIMLRYLYHYIQTIDVTSLIHGNIPKLTGGDFRSLKIAVPPLEVQREMVHILDSFMMFTAELTTELIAEFTARKKQYEFYRDKILSVKNNISIVKLKDIATDFYRGSGIKRDEVTEEGIPCVRYGEIYTTYNNTWFDKCVSHTKLEYIQSPRYFEYGDILFAITGESVVDIAKSVAYVGNEKCLAGGDIVVMKHNQNPRYLAHVLATTNARMQKSKGKVKSKVVHSSVPSIKEIEIPLPSLEIQKRYADILDNFEAICIDLNISLPAEIEARQKQYEYYRDLLLTYAETNSILAQLSSAQLSSALSAIRLIQYIFGSVWLKIGDVTNMFRGDYITKKGTIAGNIPVILGGQEPAYYINQANHIGEIVVIARSGASAGFVSYWNEPIFVTDGFGYEAKEEFVITKYLYYVMKNMENQFNDMKRGAGVPHINGEAILNITIPIPSLEKQKELIKTIEKFDIFCNDLVSGLSAEIETRQKQYAYYRDRLLTF